jgi:prepilin-type N-terminal cleavage/methylation domain-containing protein/prepilin-type processing-associated H-X9-DG protein
MPLPRMTLPSSRRERRSGFTLTELLIVIAIIALLAAMLLPALASAKAKGHAIACLNSEKQLSLACLLYAGDFEDRLPYNMGVAEIKRTVAQGEFLNWTSPVLNWEVDSDNTNVILQTEGGIGPYVTRSAGLYRCPSDSVVSDLQAAEGWARRVRSMSMNMMIGDAGEFSRSGANVNNPYYRQFFKTTQVPEPARIFVLIEEHPDSINDGYFIDQPGTYRWMDLPASWHGGAANLSFADGHSETHRWRFASTKPAARPDVAQLPFDIPVAEEEDFEWLMSRMSIEAYPGKYGGRY